MNKGLSAERIAVLLQPYLVQHGAVPAALYTQLESYLALLLKWNARTNLTAIRDPDEIVRRHFGESLFVGQLLGNRPVPRGRTLLDYGSGAGFPGLPLALLQPALRVTLAESQNKKATFLREVVRSLGAEVEVWAARVEAMPASRRFDLVTLRAVDCMETAIAAAAERAAESLLIFSTAGAAEAGGPGEPGAGGPALPPGFAVAETVVMPGSLDCRVYVFRRSGAPGG